MIKIGFVSLGCPKNQVDSEYMYGMLFSEPGFELVEEIDKAEVIVINTCGFIKDAKEESIETIIEAGRYKEQGSCQAIIVTGCLTQRYQQEILTELPEVDAILGTGTFDQIVATVKEVMGGLRQNKVGSPTFEYSHDLPRRLTTAHLAYVKIAEGCNNNCTYCSIPRIRGKVNSREIDDIFDEVKQLVNDGVKEIILVAQDTTQYGVDIYGQPALIQLLNKLVTIEDLQWLRLLYSYPEYITDELIELISREDKICNYLDLPVQHSADRIRKLMHRQGKRDDLVNLVKKLRSQIPDIAIRTSLIVGFPGETEDDYLDLVNFVKEVRFDRLGVFKYSREEDTPADKLPGHLSEEVKEERFERIMQIQQKISLDRNQSYVGKELEVIIDEVNDDYALGRTRYDAPEIDNQIYIESAKIEPGTIIRCRINSASEYDLIGEEVDEST